MALDAADSPSITHISEAAARLKAHAASEGRPLTQHARFVGNAWKRYQHSADAYADAPRSGRPTLEQQQNIPDKALQACYKDLSQGYVWQQGGNTTKRAYQVGAGLRRTGVRCPAEA